MENKFINSTAAELLGKLGQTSPAKTEEIAKIINQHSMIAAGAGWIPFPFVDLAVVAGNVWKMYVSINKVIGISFTGNFMKSVGSGVVANLSSAIVSSQLFSLLKLIPGLGTVSAGLLLMAGNYATCTTAGWVYLKALTSIASDEGVIDPSDPEMKKKFKRAVKEHKDESKKLKDELQKDYILEEKEKEEKEKGNK